MRSVSDANAVLSTFEKLIVKYSGKNTFFRIARNLRVGLFSKIVRFFLWIVKQATAQPSADQGRDAARMSHYWSGFKRYAAFTFVGILIGLLISFFLPDAISDFATFLWTHIKKFVFGVASSR